MHVLDLSMLLCDFDLINKLTFEYFLLDDNYLDWMISALTEC